MIAKAEYKAQFELKYAFKISLIWPMIRPHGEVMGRPVAPFTNTDWL